MLKYLVVITFILLSSVSTAQQPHQAIIDWAKTENSDSDSSGDLLRLRLPFKEGVYLQISNWKYSGDQPEDKLKVKETGGGFYWATGTDSSFYIGYSKLDLTVSTFEEKPTQYSFGWRARLMKDFELNLEYNDTGFDNPLLESKGQSIALHYYFSETFAITAETREFAGQDTVSLGVRFTSGK